MKRTNVTKMLEQAYLLNEASNRCTLNGSTDMALMWKGKALKMFDKIYTLEAHK